MGWFRTDKSTKYAEALLKVSANLLDVATEPARPDHAPLVLSFERPDGKLRYAASCLGSAYYFSVDEDSLVVMDEALRKAWTHIATLAADETAGFIEGRPSNSARHIVIQEAREELGRTIDGWREYAAHFQARAREGRALKRDEASTRIVCTMLRRLETDGDVALTDVDMRRLEPLAQWIEETTASIRPSVLRLAR
jgi:hypothetical protein